MRCDDHWGNQVRWAGWAGTITHTLMNLVINFLQRRVSVYVGSIRNANALVKFGAQEIVYELATLVLPGIHGLILEYQVLA